MKKNILFFTRTMGLGGTENVVLQLCDIMVDKYNVIVCSSGGVNVEKLKYMGIKHYTIPDIEDKSLSNFIDIFIKLNKIFKKEKIDIIHTHHRMASFYTFLLNKIYNFKFFVTVHNTFLDKRILTKLSYTGANIVAVGEQVKSNLCDFYKIDSNKVTVIKNAVKPFEGEIKEVEIISRYKRQGNYIVGNIGRLSEQKGMKYFIEAIPIVLDRIHNVKFFIIGDGEEKEMLQSVIKRNGLEESVILLGYRKDVQNIMMQLDLIVLSSLWEGLPLTPIEAFSVKKTVVATAVDGTIEIVKNNQNGVTVNSKDSIALGNSIIKLLENSELRESYEKNAFKTYEEEFSFEALINNYRCFYEEN
ncbi:glycosyltransferase family 4 protein [Clostridium saudiense]|uniref:Glycosyltransferase family 4 protein n=1 Tax=Clostridium saudiense TaxID=1414720 RepID=A0ABS2FL43_9CLOT|nr:glycosyltransferase family 4 protein [Clostridium saudiense]MBM6820676.1 glycosyltransferase family 4 protein [Clostridium saudiense]